MNGDIKQAKGRPKGKRKDGRTISCYVQSDIYAALMRHCELTGQTKTTAIERAIEQMTKNNGTFGNGRAESGGVTDGRQ